MKSLPCVRFPSAPPKLESSHDSTPRNLVNCWRTVSHTRDLGGTMPMRRLRVRACHGPTVISAHSSARKALEAIIMGVGVVRGIRGENKNGNKNRKTENAL